MGDTKITLPKFGEDFREVVAVEIDVVRRIPVAADIALRIGEWAGFPHVQKKRKIGLIACKAAQ